MIGDNNDEILLSNEENRLTVHPIKFENVWELYKKQQKCFWTAEEIDFSKDTKDWEKLKIEEKLESYSLCRYILGSGAPLTNAVGASGAINGMKR